MIPTKDMLKQLDIQGVVFEIFIAFHEILHNVPTDELDNFMMMVIDETNNKYGAIEEQTKEILKFVLEAEKYYRSKYKI